MTDKPRKQTRKGFEERRTVAGVGAGTGTAVATGRLMAPLATGAGAAGAVASKVVPPIAGIAAGYGAYQGAGEDNNMLRGAARGAVRALDPSALARSPGYAEEAFNARFGKPDPVQFKRTWGEAVGDTYRSARDGVARAFDAANRHFHDLHLTGGGAQVPDSGDTFQRTRHDARSGKEINEVVRKRGRQ